MRNFKELKIWQKGFEIAINSFRITKSFPLEERLGLATQIRQAGVSVPANIAEGSSRSNAKDYSRFIEISLGSSFELETQFLIARKMQLGDLYLIDATLDLLDEEEKMLTAFSKTLLQKSR